MRYAPSLHPDGVTGDEGAHTGAPLRGMGVGTMGAQAGERADTQVCPYIARARWADTQVRPYNEFAGGRAHTPVRPHSRRSIRLSGYDYSQSGAYFVTVCTQDRACLFGSISDDDALAWTAGGRMVVDWWGEVPRKFPGVDTDAFVVMPNHIHGIVVIDDVGADPCVRPDDDEGAHAGAPLQGAGAHAGNEGAHTGAPLQGTAPQGTGRQRTPLHRVVQWFKTMTTNGYIRGGDNMGWHAFDGRLWQRNYFEHVIRNEASLERIRQYITDNPARWALDRENPKGAAREAEEAWQI